MDSFRIFPLWWPLLAAVSPAVVPLLLLRNKRFKQNRQAATRKNRQRIRNAAPLSLSELEFLELTVLVEEKTQSGFVGDAGVSYIFKSDRGTLLFDVGFGQERPAFPENAKKLGFDLGQVDAIAISHLHPDHMGGVRASRKKEIFSPDRSYTRVGELTCYTPENAVSRVFQCQTVDAPKVLSGGIASTGPLARSLFFFGLTEEQALIARLKNRGLVVFTGCGHPTADIILEMVRHISDEPIYAFGGGLHFPITGGRGNLAGIQIQTIIGTGKPPWEKISGADMNRTIEAINRNRPEKVYLSGHDSCDWALAKMQERLRARTHVLEAGKTYRF